MARSKGKSGSLVQSAKVLFAQRGFRHTSLAQVAEHSGVPLGNVYYHFKTKDHLGQVVLAEWEKSLSGLFRELERNSDPRQRLLAFIDATHTNRNKLTAYGCPIGSLSQELSKHRTPLSERAAGLLNVQIEWATEQFRQMGIRQASDCAHRLLTALQGATLLAHSLDDPLVLVRELKRLAKWVREM